MQIKYIQGIGNHSWQKISQPEDAEIDFLVTFMTFIYQIKENDKDIFVTELRLTLANLVTKQRTSEAMKSRTASYAEAKALLTETLKIIEGDTKFDVFNFSSNDDFPIFIEWVRKRDDRLSLELEKL